MNCKCCNKPLNISLYSQDHQYKSCPKCSVNNGNEHVFLPYPSEFGQTDKRITANHPDGPQSYCTVHRSDPTAPARMGAITCSKLERKLD